MSRERGFQFEQDFVAMARDRGYKARRIPGIRQHDAVVGSKTVQCKDKQFDEHGRVRIARGQKKYRRGAWDVLALRWKGDVYLIPEKLLRTANGTLLTVIRPRLFKRWINAWHVFDGQDVMRGDPMLFSLDEDATDGTHS